jgi:hypothetical protein
VALRQARLEHTRERNREKERRVRAAAAARNPKPKAPPKAMTIVKKPAQNAPVHVPTKKKADAWKDAPVVIPPTVKVQKLPGYKPRTFAPPPWFKGEFQREWAEKRGKS